LPPDDLYENKIDLTAKKAPAPTPAIALPNLPDIATAAPVKELPKPVASPITEPVTPIAANPVPDAVTQSAPVPNQNLPLPEDPEEEVAIEEFDKPKTVPEIVTVQSPSPVPQAESRIWPWPKGEAWDARRVHREVVSALELVKSGKKDEAASTIDTLGPHLTNDNIDLFYHIGMVLKQLDRTEDVRSMIQRANLEMPGNEHVSSAMAHLGV